MANLYQRILSTIQEEGDFWVSDYMEEMIENLCTAVETAIQEEAANNPEAAPEVES